MKRLRPSLTLTLIGLALFLSAANPGPSVQSPKSLAQQGNQTAQNSQADAKAPTLSAPTSTKIPPAPNPVESHSRPHEGAHNAYKYALALGNGVLIWLAGAIQGLSIIVTAVATAFLAGFTYQLVSISRDMHTATKAATQIAELALNAEKPYLFIEGLHLRHDEVSKILPPSSLGLIPLFGRPHPIRRTETVLIFDVRNRGRGIAIFQSLHLRPFVKRYVIQKTGKKDLSIGRSAHLPVTGQIMDAGDFLRFYAIVQDEVSPIRFANRGDVQFAVSGFVKYQDTYERIFRTGFCYLHIAADERHEGSFYLGPQKNRRTYQHKEGQQQRHQSARATTWRFVASIRRIISRPVTRAKG